LCAKCLRGVFRVPITSSRPSCRRKDPGARAHNAQLESESNQYNAKYETKRLSHPYKPLGKLANYHTEGKNMDQPEILYTCLYMIISSFLSILDFVSSSFLKPFSASLLHCELSGGFFTTAHIRWRNQTIDTRFDVIVYDNDASDAKCCLSSHRVCNFHMASSLLMLQEEIFTACGSTLGEERGKHYSKQQSTRHLTASREAQNNCKLPRSRRDNGTTGVTTNTKQHDLTRKAYTEPPHGEGTAAPGMKWRP
jgi:hypothetical protein